MRRAAWLALLLGTSACAGVIRPGGPSAVQAPAVRTEMRGLWVATVANIDWPSRKGLTAAAQQKELRDILDRASRAGFNTIVGQQVDRGLNGREMLAHQ